MQDDALLNQSCQLPSSAVALHWPITVIQFLFERVCILLGCTTYCGRGVHILIIHCMGFVLYLLPAMFTHLVLWEVMNSHSWFTFSTAPMISSISHSDFSFFYAEGSSLCNLHQLIPNNEVRHIKLLLPCNICLSGISNMCCLLFCCLDILIRKEREDKVSKDELKLCINEVEPLTSVLFSYSESKRPVPLLKMWLMLPLGCGRKIIHLCVA